MALSAEQQLKLISRAWGKQVGYVFFPWIDGKAMDKAQRIRGYNEGPAFKWPTERASIQNHLEAHTKDDLYWCPSIFEKPMRRMELAMDEHALWADLDQQNPEEIDDEYRPTVAWESSPGRYQALWLITGGDLQGASWPGNENQRLTYLLEADHSGWDTTQLLRIPGWNNHKPEYKENNDGKPVRGKLLWSNGRRYLPDDFDHLPEVRGADAGNLATDVLEDEIKSIDRLKTWGAVRLKCSKEVRELVSARATGGQDRSEKLWQIERDLADAGLTVPQIVAIVRETVWNKFAGRSDELRRLLTEAAKAIGERSEATEEQLERDREEKPAVQNIFTLVKNAEPPVWLVKYILTEAACGFLAGEPKSFKSWCGLDLALSVATGAPFLNAFDVLQPGPVLYIQEEDPLPTMKARLGILLPFKIQDRVIFDKGDDGTPLDRLVWEPAEDNNYVPKINAIVREQFVVSDTGWQAWLDEVLTEGYGPDKEPYKLLVIDPLMMVQGDVDSNNSQAMTEHIYKPLGILAEKHHCAIQIVNHMRKGRENDTSTRGGQKMLGSVANHAWSESSLYFTHGKPGTMLVETESKHAETLKFAIHGLRKRTKQNALTWQPEVQVLTDEDATEQAGSSGNSRTGNHTRRRNSSGRVGQGTRKRIARELGMHVDSSQADVRRAWEDRGGIWGQWDLADDGSADHVELDDLQPVGQGQRKERGRPKDKNPAALVVLKKLTERKPRAYSTTEIRDELAKELKVKPTQTIYLRAYQQLKKLYDNDEIGRIEKDWVLLEVDTEDLDEAEMEDLI